MSRRSTLVEFGIYEDEGRFGFSGFSVNHGITSSAANSGDTPLGAGEFIARYVFPNGELPHISLALQSMQQGGLEATDVESLRRHYARTLDIWAERSEAHADEVRRIVGEKRFRIWRVYFLGCACACAFHYDDISIYQVVCRKTGRLAEAIPWSCSYMYDAAGM